MSQKIDPKDVLTYLNDLGYTNITAQLLKDFIKDLKKLIKYENRHREKENVEDVTSINLNERTSSCSRFQPNIKKVQSPSSAKHCDDSFCNCNTSRDREQGDMFKHLHNQHTVASRAKEVPRREKHISVHIRKPKNKTELHEHCTHLEQAEEQIYENEDLQLIQNIETISDGSKLYINTESTIKSIHPTSKPSLTLTTKPSTTRKKSKSSFIRSNSAKSLKKSDPVALYQFYQDQWKKQKFPGQENHFDLRWSVREKMLAGPKVDTAPRCRRRRNSWKG